MRARKVYAELLLTPGIGARTVEALAFVAEVLHGAPSRFSDPARFSLAHGGKDGHPFPVPIKVFDETIRTTLMEIDVATHSKWIDIAADDGTFQAYLASPHTGKGPGIVLIQEIFGVNQHIREVADQYAADGYVVLAPDIFWRAEPRAELGYEGADRDKGIAIMRQTDFSKSLKDLGATAQALRKLPALDGKIAAIGYCFGGRLAYNAAASGFVDAAVAYYGGGIQNQLERAVEIKVPILFHYAEEDSSIPLSAVDEVKKRFAGRDNAEFHLYMGAHHGFNCPYRASYQQHASALAHGRTLMFLANRL